MENECKLYFRDQLRSARAQAFSDTESFGPLVFVLERLGVFKKGKIGKGLEDYRSVLTKIANQSPLSKNIPQCHRSWHTPFHLIFGMVSSGRNDALHEGAFARHLTTHAIQLSLVLEDGLMVDSALAAEFMTRNVVQAYPWQPVSSVRQTMLENSFSFLPVLISGTWALISDFHVAQYLRDSGNDKNDRFDRLARRLELAIQNAEIPLNHAAVCSPESPVVDVLRISNEKPVLVTSQERPEILLGIISPFDLL